MGLAQSYLLPSWCGSVEVGNRLEFSSVLYTFDIPCSELSWAVLGLVSVKEVHTWELVVVPVEASSKSYIVCNATG